MDSDFLYPHPCFAHHNQKRNLDDLLRSPRDPDIYERARMAFVSYIFHTLHHIICEIRMDLVEAKTRFHPTLVPQIAAGGEGWSIKKTLSIPLLIADSVLILLNGGFGTATKMTPLQTAGISSITGISATTT